MPKAMRALVTTIVILAAGAKADAGVINVYNYASGVGNQVINLKIFDGATNGWDGYPPDAVYSDPVQTVSLKIYSKVDGSPTGLVSTDSRGLDTSGWDFYLGVKGSVNNLSNAIKFLPSNMTDLSGLQLSAYDVAQPELIYPITNELNVITTVALPNLTASNVEYAHWRLDVTPIPAPSTFILLGIGAVSLAAYHWRRSRLD